MLGLLPFVEAMVRRGLPRTGAVLLLLLGFLAVLIGLFSIIVPAIVEEADAVRDNLPESAREIEELLDYFGINVELQERARNIDWDELISGRAAFDYTQRVATVVFSILTIIVLTAYLLADTPRLGNFFSQFIPPTRKDEADKLFWSLTRVVGGYLRGQAITSMAIGLFTFVVLRIVGVPNALAFAVLAAFADVIPLIGAFIAIIPPVAAALQESSTQALIVLVALFLYQQFEDRYLVPRVYGRTLNLPPVIVLIAVLAGAELLGITGVLLALPLTAAGRVAMDYLLENRSWLLSQEEEQIFAPDMEFEDDASAGEPASG
jgi:predicted PurR-regulated permease PerM